MGDGEVNGKQCGAARERGEVASKCPECGTARSERTPATPWAVRHRFKLKFAALFLVLGFVVVQNVRTWPVAGQPFSYTTQRAAFPKHQYTQAVLEQYALGEFADGQLVDDLYNTYLFGNFELEAAFVLPAGEVRDGVSFGWPAGFAFSYFLTKYDDLYARTNAQPGRTYTMSAWTDLIYMRQRIDAQGRYSVFWFAGLAVMFQVLLVAIAWSVGKLLRRALFTLRIARKDMNRNRERFAKRLPLLFAAACATGFAAMSSLPIPLERYVIPDNTSSTGTKTGLMNEDLAQLRNDPAGDAKAAAAILNVASDPTLDPNASLIFSWSSEEGGTHTGITGGWPQDAFDVSIQRAAHAVRSTGGLPRVILRRRVTRLDVMLLFGDPPVRLSTYTFSLYDLGLMGMAMYVAWWLPGWTVWVIHGRAKRRSVKRADRGQCARCGYDLAGI